MNVPYSSPTREHITVRRSCQTFLASPSGRGFRGARNSAQSSFKGKSQGLALNQCPNSQHPLPLKLMGVADGLQ